MRVRDNTLNPPLGSGRDMDDSVRIMLLKGAMLDKRSRQLHRRFI